MATINFPDAKSGRWFRYNGAECASCYLNHEHSYEQHVASIAHSRAAARAHAEGGDYETKLVRAHELSRSMLPLVRQQTPLVDEAWS